MNKNEYISRLAKGMEKYNVANKYDILADYEQIVDEILIDNDDDFNAVIDKLGYPEILAMDIMEELGHEPQKSERQENQSNANDSSHRYGVKRQKSNVIWNIILFFYYIVQAGLSLALVTVIGFGLYFGFDSTASVDSRVVSGQVETRLNICHEDKCRTYVFNYDNHSRNSYRNEFSIQKCTDSECKMIDGITHSASFPVGFAFGLASAIIAVMIWLFYVIVYKNVRAVVKKNDEYNRRRSYE